MDNTTGGWQMKIYKLDFDVNNYENLRPCFDANADFYQMFEGSSLKEMWGKYEVKRMYPEECRELGDAPGFCLPVFNKRALDCLYPLIKDSVEILPFRFEGGELYGINVITVLDALDYENSDYVTFSDGKRIMAIEKYAFKKSVVEGINIFKIVDETRGEPFVSEDFYRAVKDNNLKGFHLELVDDH